MWHALRPYIRKFQARKYHPDGLATIKDIPTEQFNAILDGMCAEGWRKSNEYKGFDAWIDYGCLTLKKDGVKLLFEWENWTEGSIAGPAATIEALGATHDLAVVYEWRWNEHEGAP